MIFTSKYISLTAPTTGRVKRGFFTLGEAAQKKLYAVEYVPSLPREWGLFFTLLSLAHAAAGIPPSLPGMPHSATIRVSRHCTTGDFQTPQRSPAWATSASGSLRSVGFKADNQLKPYRKAFYGPQCRQCTRERRPL